jgi:hypothetical protein
VNATGTIIVTAANTAGAPSSSPTLCINTALTNITIVTTGATGISNSGVSGANGLPAGVSAAWATNTITISGTPTASGTFNYSIPLTGGCGSVNATGSIVVLQTTGSVSYWNGNTSGLWATSTNWCGSVPSCSQSAVIPSGTPNSPTISAAGAACLNLTINSGATLTMSTTNTLGVCGNWVNNGTFTANSSIIYFIGTTNQSLTGAGAQSFYDLTINNTGTSGSNSVTLSQPTTVTDKLALTSGLLATDATNILKLTNTSSSATNGGSSTSYVNGPMTWSLTTATTYIFPTGSGSSKWARVAISGNTVTTNFTCQYFNSSYSNVSTVYLATTPTPTLTTVSQKEYWTVTPVSTTTASVTLYWEDASFSRINSCATNGELCVAHYNTAGSNKWENANSSGVIVVTGTCAGYSGSGTVKSDAMSSFSPFTFGSEGSGVNPLPIELLSFNAVYNGKTTDLTWSTASEINSNYFTIERSTDGINFTVVGIVDSKALNGNSTGILNYTLNDPNTAPGTYYYRLKQTDFDYKYTYSNVVAITIASTIDFSVDLAPNPNDGKQLTVFITSPLNGTVDLTIYDMLGKLLFAKSLDVVKGANNSFSMQFAEVFSSGTYVVTATLNQDLTKKIRLLITN